LNGLGHNRSRRDKPARNERAKSTKASSAVARTAAPPKESSALAAFGFKLEKGQSQVDTLKPKSPAAKKAAASCVDDDDDNEGLSDEAEFDDGASSDGDSEDFANDSSAAGQGNGAMDESESDAEAVAKEVDWVVGDHVEVKDMRDVIFLHPYYNLSRQLRSSLMDIFEVAQLYSFWPYF
jgi:hypothetical protein